ncbi:MAG: hypothetical protein SFT90_03385 [Rickettsiales bacterium]|nr:hypothetical protein [Rickettsiales bacterium]
MKDLFTLANDEILALVKDSEICANNIMQSAENISKLAEAVSNQEIAGLIKMEIAKIFEATYFQDFTGQRCTKLKEIFSEIFEKTGSISAKEKSFEKSLMEGPQTETASQEDIDKLFNS